MSDECWCGSNHSLESGPSELPKDGMKWNGYFKQSEPGATPEHFKEKPNGR